MAPREDSIDLKKITISNYSLDIHLLSTFISPAALRDLRITPKPDEHNEQARPRPHLPPPYLFPGPLNEAMLIAQADEK